MTITRSPKWSGLPPNRAGVSTVGTVLAMGIRHSPPPVVETRCRGHGCALDGEKGVARIAVVFRLRKRDLRG